MPHLTERIGLALATLVVGLVWAAWHLPLFFARSGHIPPVVPILCAAGRGVFRRSRLALPADRGSLPLTMFMHSAFNNLKELVPSAGVPVARAFTLHATLVLRCTVLLLWLVGMVLLARMRGVARLSSGPTKLSFRAAA